MDYNSLDIYWAFYNYLIKNTALSYGLTIAKAITSLLLVIQAARMYFSSYKVNMQENSPTYYELFRPFLLIIAIVSYSYIVDTFDDIAVTAETYVYNSFKTESSVEKLMKDMKTAPKAKEDTETNTLIESISDNVNTIATYLNHPTLIFVKAIDFFISWLDSVAYTFVIILRFAFLFILRFLGPFALALSIYSRFEGWWANWAKAYGIVYLWVIVIFLINFFASGIAHGIYKVIYAAGDGKTEVMAFMVYNSTVWCLVLVKVYLYFKSKKLLDKIFA
jgi:hypothetical protein